MFYPSQGRMSSKEEEFPQRWRSNEQDRLVAGIFYAVFSLIFTRFSLLISLRVGKASRKRATTFCVSSLWCDNWQSQPRLVFVFEVDNQTCTYIAMYTWYRTAHRYITSQGRRNSNPFIRFLRHVSRNHLRTSTPFIRRVPPTRVELWDM